MKITFIELVGYKRMALRGIKRFCMRPKARIQLVLGANGSGKSSLISELTPLPADRNNYTKDGSKTIEIQDQGNSYTLKSDFSAHHVHSFIKNGEEMNEGGTITVQKELVKAEFGITQETHDICTGVERFSQMSPSRRRKILTDLCEENYDYALRVFDKIKENLRDTSGALKLAKKRLVTETSKLVQPEVESQITTEVTLIMQQIDLLYARRTPEKRDRFQVDAERRHLIDQITQLSYKVMEFKGANRVMFQPEELEVDIVAGVEEAGSLRGRIDVLTQEFEQLRKDQEVFLKTGNADAKALMEQIEALRTFRNSLLDQRKLGLEFTDIMAAKAALDAAEMVELIFVEIPENADRRFSQKVLQELRDKSFELKAKIKAIDAQLDQLHHSKQHMENLIKTGHTECPRCQHKWIMGYSENDHKQTNAKIESLAVDKQAIEVILKDVEEKILKNEQYGVVIRDYMRIVRSTPALDPFWEYIRDNDLIYTYPRQCIVKLDQLKRDISLGVDALASQKEIDRLQDLHELALKAGNTSVANVTEKMAKLEENLGTLTARLRTVQTNLDENRRLQKKTAEFIEDSHVIASNVNQLRECYDEEIESLERDILNNCLNELQIELARRQNMLNDFKMQHGIVDDIKAQVTALERQEQVYKLIQNELSPTDGLIAEGLLGFIRTFVRKMNLIIAKIWTYRMEVQDCSVGEGDTAELDYKFPLLVNDESNVSPDVSKTSRGQMEVVDLTFRIVATSYYGLNEAPLFLDEFGSSMDTEHRSTVTRAINNIMEQLPFSQLFMVSHFMEHYGAFRNAEVCALTTFNVVLPEVYNEHVEIT